MEVIFEHSIEAVPCRKFELFDAFLSNSEIYLRKELFLRANQQVDKDNAGKASKNPMVINK